MQVKTQHHVETANCITVPQRGCIDVCSRVPVWDSPTEKFTQVLRDTFDDRTSWPPQSLLDQSTYLNYLVRTALKICSMCLSHILCACHTISCAQLLMSMIQWHSKGGSRGSLPPISEIFNSFFTKMSNFPAITGKLFSEIGGWPTQTKSWLRLWHDLLSHAHNLLSRAHKILPCAKLTISCVRVVIFFAHVLNGAP